MENKKTKKVWKEYEVLKTIIKEIMDTLEYPSFDFLNGVLSCEKLFGDKKIWCHWDKLLIVEGEKVIASDMEELIDWNTEEDGTITLIGKKWN